MNHLQEILTVTHENRKCARLTTMRKQEQNQRHLIDLNRQTYGGK